MVVLLLTWANLARGQDIVAMEYFFDSDPGVGGAIPITVTGPAPTVNVNEILNSASLPLGFHVLFLRAQTDGHVEVSMDPLDYTAIVTATQTRWGSVESRLVFVDESGASLIEIDTLEYFFDVDPGYGNATAIQATAGNVVNLVESIPTGALSPGFHTLFIRAQTTADEWGFAESRLVFVQAGDVGQTVLVDQIEYFFDADPGYGNATIINITTPQNIVNFLDTLDAASLTPGFHTLFLRARGDGGKWGQAESRLVFVQAGDVGNLVLVDQVEYFFDIDPGYGNATTINLTPNNVVNFTDSLDASGLSLGFHTLFLRARGQGGKWGQAESRLVYVDESGALFSNLSELEWFIDTDPGYGLGNTVPLGDVPDANIEFNVPYGAISEGAHVLGFRARNADGRWGVTEWRPFAVFTPGRELDSASLVVMYNQLGGTSWTNQSNWLVGDIDNWYGVDVVNGRVDSIEFGSNNLVGEIPFQAGYFDQAKKIDLSDNQLLDTIPQTFDELTGLEELYLNANDLSEIPNIAGLANLDVLALDSNLFDFGDLEPHIGINNFTYENQKIFGDSAVDSIATISAPLDIALNIPVEGTNNIYQWYLNGQTIPSGDLPTYQILGFSATDTGKYVLEVTNSVVSGLTLTSSDLRFTLSNFDQDSLAMVSLYQSTDGPAWTNGTNWLTGNLSTWNGITLTGPRVTDVNLASNNLTGVIPDNFSVADSMVSINLEGNSLEGAIPLTFLDLNVVDAIDVSENALISIPNFSTVPSLTTLDVANNKLDFEFLENNLGVGAGFTYTPQDTLATPIIIDITLPDLPADTIPLPDDFVVESNSNVNFEFDVGGANNTYQWLLDDQPISGATADNIQIDNIDFANEGEYRLQITNSIVTGLTLTTQPLQAFIASLERDSTALRNLYEANGGANWNPAVNWTTEPDIQLWDGVNVPGGTLRVEGLNLVGRGVAGNITKEFRVITGLNEVLLQDNEITGLPNLSQMPNLDSLNVTNNFLDYPDIEPNIFLSGFAFNPQKPLPLPDTTKVEHGTTGTLDHPIGGTNNTYQWYFEDVEIAGETGETLTIDSAIYEDMGNYYKEATSSIIAQADPTFTLRTEDQVLAVTADIDVTPIYQDGGNVTLDEGEAFIFRSNDPGETGRLDTTGTVVITTAGFTFEDIVLDEYLIFIRTDGFVGPNNVELIPTYYQDKIDWAQADTLILRENTAVTVDMENVPPDTEGEGIVDLTLESDFEEDPAGRLEARRRVQKAGCSLRRRTTGGGGRPSQDDDFVLIAYKETDENGQVNFGDLPNGFYRLNIQYPGIPVDPNSFVEFEIDANGGVGGYELEATVTEEGIVVERILGLTSAYFKDLNVYPVPASNEVSISYQRLRTKDIYVRLVDMGGKTISEKMLPKGVNQKLTLDVSKMREGIYLLYFFDTENNDVTVASYKVIVNH